MTKTTRDWLFSLLLIIPYGVIVFAVTAFLGSGKEWFLDVILSIIVIAALVFFWKKENTQRKDLSFILCITLIFSSAFILS